MVLYRLLVCDEKHGVCFVDLPFMDVINTTNLGEKKLKATSLDMCKMIVAFYQIGRTFGDDTDEAHICFEEKLGDQSGKMRIPSGMSRSFNSRRQRLKAKTIQLHSFKVNNLIGAIYVDERCDINSVKGFLNEVLKEFESKYEAQVTELLPSLQVVAQDSAAASKVRSQFQDFEEIARKLKDKRFDEDKLDSNRTVESEESDITDDEEDEDNRDSDPKLEHLS